MIGQKISNFPTQQGWLDNESDYIFSPVELNGMLRKIIIWELEELRISKLYTKCFQWPLMLRKMKVKKEEKHDVFCTKTEVRVRDLLYTLVHTALKYNINLNVY